MYGWRNPVFVEKEERKYWGQTRGKKEGRLLKGTFIGGKKGKPDQLENNRYLLTSKEKGESGCVKTEGKRENGIMKSIQGEGGRFLDQSTEYPSVVEEGKRVAVRRGEKEGEEEEKGGGRKKEPLMGGHPTSRKRMFSEKKGEGPGEKQRVQLATFLTAKV